MLHNEARELLVKGYKETHNAKEIAKIFGVAERTVYRLVKQEHEEGTVALRTSRRGRKPLLSDTEKDAIRQCIADEPDITINEIREKLHLAASRSTVERAVKAMGYTFKKKTLCASERHRARCSGKTGTMDGTNES